VAAMTDVRVAGISALVHTKNEERYISQVLGSLAPFVDEIVVVDMHSTDQTREIARQAGARVETVDDFGFVEPARALGVAMCRHEWILNLDADEVVTPTLGHRLRTIALEGKFDVVRLGRRNYMFGQPLLGSGWSPRRDSHDRFYRHDSVIHSPVLHSPSRPTEGARLLDLSEVDDALIHHFNYVGWDEFISKMNRYTSITAAERHANSQRPSLAMTSARAAKDAFTRLVLDRGYRDGSVGLGLVHAMASYHFLTHAKQRQLARGGGSADIQAAYGRIAASIADSETDPANPPADGDPGGDSR
jgi:glycosyltransferase involved in cell wall biosynthesis